MLHTTDTPVRDMLDVLVGSHVTVVDGKYSISDYLIKRDSLALMYEVYDVQFSEFDVDEIVLANDGWRIYMGMEE